jgi:hypothetical protein
MKAYTSLEQSKKLAEILPIESADMWWAERYTGRVENYEYIVEEKPVYYLSLTKPSEENYSQDTIKDIPCWSLAALLEAINDDYFTTLYHDGIAWNIEVMHHDNLKDKHNVYENTPVDACYKLILKLHEQKLL